MIGYVVRKFPVLSETFILNELIGLEKLGYQFHVFSLNRPNDPRFHPNLSQLKAHITYIPDILKWKELRKHQSIAAKKFKKKYWQTLRYVIRHFSPTLYLRFLQSCFVANHSVKLNIVHFHSHFATRPTTITFLTTMLLDIRYTFTAHAVDIFKTSLSVTTLHKKLAQAKFVITVSDYNKKHLHTIHPNANICKINNGIDLSRFQHNVLESKPFTFICVARFVEKKGHDILLKACQLLKGEYRLWLVGTGPRISRIRHQIQAKNLQNKVLILGPHTHEEVVERYQQSHVYVLPCCVGKDGNRDGLPVSIVEALACGLPVITTPMTGNPEVVMHEVNGLLVPFHDAKKTAEAMQRVMDNQDLYKKLSHQARPSIQDEFDQKKTIANLSQLFEGCYQ